MVAIGACMNEKTSLYFTEPKVGMNGDPLVNMVMEHLVGKDVPRLYPGEKHKVTLQMDFAPAQMDKKHH